jgi:hypothetical protein
MTHYINFFHNKESFEMPPLTAEIIRDLLEYDKSTGIMIWKKPPKRHPRLLGREAGGPRSSGTKVYQKIVVFRKHYSRSRLAFLWVTGRWPSECIDHINGNSLDDRWLNLREATIMQNAWNHKKRKKKSPLPMGVRQNKYKKYVARISCNKKHISIGVFETPEEASNAYQEKRKELFNEYA